MLWSVASAGLFAPVLQLRFYRRRTPGPKKVQNRPPVESLVLYDAL